MRIDELSRRLDNEIALLVKKADEKENEEARVSAIAAAHGLGEVRKKLSELSISPVSGETMTLTLELLRAAVNDVIRE